MNEVDQESDKIRQTTKLPDERKESLRIKQIQTGQV